MHVMAMLELLALHRDEILRVAVDELARAAPDHSRDEIAAGLGTFLEDVHQALRKDVGLQATTGLPGRTIDAARRGKARFEAGFEISATVRDFGSICAAIHVVGLKYGESFGVRESQVLNQCVDAGSSAAVDEFYLEARLESARQADDVVRSLVTGVQIEVAAARMAYREIQAGVVGVSSRTGAIVDRSLRRIEHLLGRALTVTRLRGPPALEMQDVDLAAWLAAIVVATPRERGVTIELEVSEDLEAEGDVSTLSSAVTHVLENAVKHSRQNGVVRVRAAPARDLVTVEVADQCGGLPPRIEADLFLPYLVEGAAGDTPRLGLALVQHAMHAHGGEVVVSNRPGEGCTFSLRWPARQAS